MREKHIIYIPGLNDQHPANKTLTKFVPLFWKQYGFTGHIFEPHWEDGRSYKPKLQVALSMVDGLIAKDYDIFIVGQSAGGSLAGHVFKERIDSVIAYANITGRVREGIDVSQLFHKHPKIVQHLLNQFLFLSMKLSRRLQKISGSE